MVDTGGRAPDLDSSVCRCASSSPRTRRSSGSTSATLLERAGFEVCAEARDGVEAVELARSEQPDLAILDVKMPRLDGIEAARRILDERPIPIVMLTAYGQEELVSRAVEAGVFGYLVKPFRESDLLPAIQTARARHEELAALREEAESLARGARRAQGDRAREGAADGEGGPLRGGRVRAAAQGEPGLRPAAEGDRRGGRRDARRLAREGEPAPEGRLSRSAQGAGGTDDAPLDPRVDGRVRRDVVDRDLQQVVARLGHVRAAGEHRVAVAAAVHEVVRDDPDRVGRADRDRRAGDAARRLPHPVDDRDLRGAVVLHLEPRDLREASGAAGEAGLAERREAVDERLPGAGRR